MPYMECRHIKTSGSKCEAPALRGKAYCYYHMRIHQALHACKADPQPSPDVEINVPAVEDTHSIQLAITEILKGLGAKRVDPRRAGRMLYGLQIASQMVQPTLYIAHDRFVQRLTTTRDGDELGPKEFVCHDDDDCNECPFYNDCPRLPEEDEEDDGNEGDGNKEDGENGQSQLAARGDPPKTTPTLSGAMQLRILRLLPKAMSRSMIAEWLRYAT